VLTDSGTFLTAHPSGTLSASTPSRGPLESFTPSFSSSSPFPKLYLRTQADKFVSLPPASFGLGKKGELRADADGQGEQEGFRVKCQREFVLKAKLALEGEGGLSAGAGSSTVKRRKEGQGGSLEDEVNRK
jgi:protein FRG1